MTVKFLCELIEKSARVILPDFGAFLVKDDGTGVFKPENITFSPFLRYNDGLVEDALSKANNISKDEAKKRVITFIEYLKSNLLENKQFQLEDYGYLSIDNRGSVSFKSGTITPVSKSKPKATAKEKSDIPISSTSKKTEESSPKEKEELKEDIKEIEQKEEKEDDILDLVKPEEVEEIEAKPKEDIKQIIEDKPKSKKAANKPTPSSESDAPSLKTASKPKVEPELISSEQQPEEYTGIGKAILIGILIAFVFVLTAVGWFLIDRGHINFKKDKVEKIVLPKLPIHSDIIEDTKDQITEKKGEFDKDFEKLSSEIDKVSVKDEPKVAASRLAETEFPSEKPTDKQKIVISYPQEGMFHLVVGSFRNPEYAEKFSNDLKSSGYNSRVVVQPSGMHAVTVGSFPIQSEALEAMDNVKIQHPNVWLLRQ